MRGQLGCLVTQPALQVYGLPEPLLQIRLALCQPSLLISLAGDRIAEFVDVDEGIVDGEVPQADAFDREETLSGTAIIDDGRTGSGERTDELVYRG